MRDAERRELDRRGERIEALGRHPRKGRSPRLRQAELQEVAHAVPASNVAEVRERPDATSPGWRGRIVSRPETRTGSCYGRERAPESTSTWSIQRAVSFSCTPFWPRRWRSPPKSTRSSSWSWLKQENT